MQAFRDTGESLERVSGRQPHPRWWPLVACDWLRPAAPSCTAACCLLHPGPSAGVLQSVHATWLAWSLLSALHCVCTAGVLHLAHAAFLSRACLKHITSNAQTLLCAHLQESFTQFTPHVMSRACSRWLPTDVCSRECIHRGRLERVLRGAAGRLSPAVVRPACHHVGRFPPKQTAA